MCATTTRTGHIWGWRKTHRRVGQWRTVLHWETGFALLPDWVACTIAMRSRHRAIPHLGENSSGTFRVTVDNFFAVESMLPLTFSFRKSRLSLRASGWSKSRMGRANFESRNREVLMNDRQLNESGLRSFMSSTSPRLTG